MMKRWVFLAFAVCVFTALDGKAGHQLMPEQSGYVKPNPFVPAAGSYLEIVVPYAHREVGVYGEDGRFIVYLLREERSRTNGIYRWTGKDQEGIPVKSGVYFAHILGSREQVVPFGLYRAPD